MTKNEFRKKYLSLRNDIPVSQKQIFDGILTKKILSAEEYRNAENILLFASVGSEVNTWGLLDESIRQNKKVYFPKCIDEKRMEFYRVFSKEDLISGMYGIPEPSGRTEKYDSNCESDLAVIPAIAVGRDFSRLGYGKGYYDRFLKDFNGITVCPVYPQFLCGTVPNDKFDIPQKIIITPNEIIRR